MLNRYLLHPREFSPLPFHPLRQVAPEIIKEAVRFGVVGLTNHIPDAREMVNKNNKKMKAKEEKKTKDKATPEYRDANDYNMIGNLKKKEK